MADNTEAFLFRDIATASIARTMEKLGIKVNIPPIDTMAVAKELGIEDQVSEESGTRNSLDSAIRLQLVKDFEDAASNAFASSAAGTIPSVSPHKPVLEEGTDKTIGDEPNARVLNTTLLELDLSARATNCLEDEKLLDVRAILTRTPAQLLKIRRFGKTSLRELKRKLADLNVRLLENSPPS